MTASDRIHPLGGFREESAPIARTTPGAPPRHGARRLGHALLAPWRGITRRRWLLWTLATLVVVLIAARIAAPYAMRWYANRVINGTPSYEGEVGQVTMHLWRGAYSIDDIVVSQIGSGDLDPFFTCAKLDFSVRWKPLLHGAIVADATFHAPVVNFAEAKQPEHQQSGKPKEPPPGQPSPSTPGPQGQPGWQDQLRKLMPIDVDRVTIAGGSVRFQNVEKGVDVNVGRLEVAMTNLTNSEQLSAEHSQVATLKATGVTIGGGELMLSGDIDPFATQPTFSLRLSLEHLDLPAVNAMTKAYADVDIERGRFDMYSEIRAVDGELSGYVRPLFTDLDIFKFKKDVKEGAKSAFIQAIAGATGKILQNQPKDRLATEVPITGRVDQPGTGVMAAIAGVLRNAFVHALLPGFKGGHRDADAPTVSGEKKDEQHAEADKQVEKAVEKSHKGP